MRNNTISVLAEDYVRMARAKGLSPGRIMWTYAGRNAILPNLTGFAMSLGFVVSGAILVEYVLPLCSRRLDVVLHGTHASPTRASSARSAQRSGLGSRLGEQAVDLG